MSLRDFEDLKTVCRVCLNKNKLLILLNNHLYGDSYVRGPLISDVLAYVMCAQMENSHPKVICPECLDHVKQAYHLRLKFENSQQVLRKCEESIIMSYKENENFEVYEVNDTSDYNFSCDSKNYLKLSGCENEVDICENKPSLENSLIIKPKKEIFDDEYTTQINSESQNQNLGNSENYEKVDEEKIDVKKSVKLKLEKNDENNKSNNIQVRCIDINKFIIEKKVEPVTDNCNLSVDKHLNSEKFSVGRLTKWKCPICNQLYSKWKLKKHILICKKLKITSLTCKECNKLFKKIKDLNYHIKLNHSTNPPVFPCKICGFICRNPSARQIHTRKNHGGTKSYICETCGKGFYYNANLLKHTSKHTKETQEVCSVCGKCFHYKGALFYHMKVHTNDRKYLCNFCDKKFYTSQSLQRHIDSHTGDRRFKCKFCDKSFRSTSERRKHEMIHTGEKPYRCEYCTKCFKSKYNLDLHTSTHRGDQPCSICAGQFLNTKVVNLHIRLKHKINLQEETTDKVDID